MLLSSFCLLSGASSCGTAGLSDITELCIIDPDSNGLICAYADGTHEIKTYLAAENYACFNPDEIKRLLESIRIPKSVQASAYRELRFRYSTIKRARDLNEAKR